MVYTHNPTYYTSLHDSFTSICKTLLPFPLKKKRLPAIVAAEQQRSKQQLDSLKWQQDSFHQILKLIGLCKEGIVAESEVSAFRTHLLETLIASPIDYEPASILRDKLIFLQELFYASCITEEEYHASKRPLLLRLANQGAEIEAKDVIVGAAKNRKDASSEEWSVIELKDEKCVPNLGKSSMKYMKKGGSVLSSASPNKLLKFKEAVREADRKVGNPPNFPRTELGKSMENPFWNSQANGKESESNSVFTMENFPAATVAAEKQNGRERGGKKPFSILFQREQKEDYGCDDNMANCPDLECTKASVKPGKKSWGFYGFKKWKKGDSEHETAPLSLDEKSDGLIYSENLVANPVGEGPDTEKMKRELHPNGASTDFFVDKVLAGKIKKELTRIRTELGAKNPNVQFSDDQIEEISTRLPIDKADLLRFFPKSWYNQYGDVVLEVVRREFQNHVREMGNSQMKEMPVEKENHSVPKQWATFDDDENSHPNFFAPREDHSSSSSSSRQGSFASSKNLRTSLSSSIDKGFKYNPFFG